MTTPARIDGTDLSHWQDGPLDFIAAGKAGAKFLFHKASEGLTYRDPGYIARRDQAKRAGLPFGAYHFARPAVSDGITQARYFLAAAGPRPGDVRSMLDLEDTGGLTITELTNWVEQFVGEYHHVTGVWPFVYTPFDLEKRFLKTTDCPLWVARYSNPMYAPRIPKPWRVHTIWQFSDGVYGLPNALAGLGHVDLNTLNSPTPITLLANFIIGAKPSPVVVHKPTKPAGITRISKVRTTFTTQRLVDVKQLDTSVRRGRRGAVKRARDQIDAAMAELAKTCGHETGNRVARVLAEYAHQRTVDVHLLDLAVAGGRVGIVKTTRDAIVAAITHTLPRV